MDDKNLNANNTSPPVKKKITTQQDDKKQILNHRINNKPADKNAEQKLPLTSLPKKQNMITETNKQPSGQIMSTPAKSPPQKTKATNNITLTAPQQATTTITNINQQTKQQNTKKPLLSDKKTKENTPLPINRKNTLPGPKSNQSPPPPKQPSHLFRTINIRNILLKYLKKLLQKANIIRKQKQQENLQKIMIFAKNQQKITRQDVKKLTGLKNSQANKYLRILTKKGRLIRFGNKRNTFYKPSGK